jgi:hypothetical protein
LLQSFARSKQGTPSERFIVNQNANRLNLIPAISIRGLVTLTTTFETFNGRKFEHFLEFDLVSQILMIGLYCRADIILYTYPK